MTAVYLALGSNVGDSLANIAQAIQLLGTSIKQINQVPIYVSKAVSYTEQPDFLNTAVSGQTALQPEALLDRLKQIEQVIGRTTTFRYGPREIDIDIILYGNLIIDTPRLVIPHPEFRSRDFVLQPLCDLNPALTDPVSGQTIKQLLAKITARQKSLIKRVDASD